MPEEPFPPSGPGAQEPQGPAPLPPGGNGPRDHGPGAAPGTGRGGPAGPPPAGPGGGWDEQPPADELEGPEQGLFVCLPAENMELSRFGGDDHTPAMAPGPLLAMVAAAVAGGDGAGLAQVPEDMLFAMISGGRRMSSWGTWLEFSAMRELALRHPVVPRRPRTPRPAAPAAPATGNGPAAGPSAAGDGRVQFDDFVADEVSCELRMSWHGAADRISYACDLAGRLPVTFAALGAGLIDPVHAKISSEQTGYLSAADAAKADPLLAAAAQHKTYAELRAAAAKLVLKPDPESAERRKAARRKTDAHVRPFREESGNAGMTARELPPDEVLASWQHVEQRARELRAAGVPGTLRELRIRAYLDLLQERDSRLTAGPVPGQHQDQHQDQGPADGPDGPDGNAGPQDGNAGPQDGPGGSGPGPRRPAGTGPESPDGHARPAACRLGEGVYQGPFGLMIVFGDREQHGQDGAGPGRAVHGHASAHGLHPVPRAGQARTAGGVGAAGADVADLHPERAGGLFDDDIHRRSARVLGGIGEGLGRDIVRGDLTRAGEPAAGSQLHPSPSRI